MRGGVRCRPWPGHGQRGRRGFWRDGG